MTTLPAQPTAVPNTSFRIRSYVTRNSRMTNAQKTALTDLWKIYGLGFSQDLLDYRNIFANGLSNVYLEIGFGSGHSLLAAAKHHPESNFIGIETYKPGIAALMIELQQHSQNNIRLFCHDAVEIITHCIPQNSLSGIHIFFPDPWQKRRHHERRLIQSEFTELLIDKLKPNAHLHLATDWEDYAAHMMRVLSSESSLINLNGIKQFSSRSVYRPCITKFEARSIREGRVVKELQFAKKE